MTLVSTIIRDAYRESNLLAISADPTVAEQEEGLRLLNRLVSSVYCSDAGEELLNLPIGRNNIDAPMGFPYYENIPFTPDWFVPVNTRLALNLTAAVTINLHPAPRDGAVFAFVDASNNLATYNLTIDGNGRNIEGTSTVVKNTNGLAVEYMFRADTANWAKISPLLSTDSMPFPSEFDDVFVIGLAYRLNPRHGVSADPQSTEMYRKALKQFKARYRQHRMVQPELALLMLKGTGRYYIYGSPGSLFDSGYGFPLGDLAR